MSNFEKVRPISTNSKKFHEVRKELSEFMELWETSGKNLRSEFICNNNGCRVVVVFDWEAASESIISTK